MKKRLFSGVIAALLIFALTPAHAVAVDGFLIEDGVLTLYTGTGGTVTIPNGVKTIGYAAFEGNTALTEIVIPDSVTAIEYSAFSRCTALKSVTLPGNLTTIGSYAFEGCTSLAYANIPENVEIIYADAFRGCSAMKQFTVHEQNKAYTSENGILYDKNKTVLLYYPAKKAGSSFAVPNSVLSIGEYAFEESKNLKSVTLGTGVREIRSYAFAGCGLTSISLGKGVTDIVFAPFYNCKSLEEIVVDPQNPLYSSENGVLYHNGINEAIKTTLFAYPAGKKDAAFKVPDNVKIIDAFAFYGNSYLMALTIEKNVTMTTSIDACSALILYGRAGSSVEVYAKEYSIPFIAGKAPPAESLVLKALPTSSTVLVNGRPVSIDAYSINQSNYFKLRDLARVLSGTSAQFDVVWDSENNAIRLTGSEAYSVAGSELTGTDGGVKIPVPNTSKIILDHFPMDLSGYIIDGNNYFKLREIAALFYFTLEWDGLNNAILINTGDL